jgi:hypothetical protein
MGNTQSKALVEGMVGERLGNGMGTAWYVWIRLYDALPVSEFLNCNVLTKDDILLLSRSTMFPWMNHKVLLQMPRFSTKCDTFSPDYQSSIYHFVEVCFVAEGYG